jgi:hypothetical protein
MRILCGLGTLQKWKKKGLLSPENVLNRKFHNKRSIGKPKARWYDVVQINALLQILGIRDWWRRACDRKEWRLLLSEARAQKGPQRQAQNGWYIHC